MEMNFDTLYQLNYAYYRRGWGAITLLAMKLVQEQRDQEAWIGGLKERWGLVTVEEEV